MTKRKEKTPEEKQQESIQSFLQHLGIFLIVNVALLIVNLISSPDTMWFYWVTIFWGIGVAMDAVDTFKPEKALAERMMARRTGSVDTGSATRSRASDPASATGSEIEQLMTHASGLIDRMRDSARRIPKPEVRREALDACAASDQVLAAIGEHPEELPLARDFVHRFLEPSTSVISEYSRLANRNVPSARETLAQVEEHDLPLITRRANGVYDRLHRGTLIDLEVAREMLTLEVADAAAFERQTASVALEGASQSGTRTTTREPAESDAGDEDRRNHE